MEILQQIQAISPGASLVEDVLLLEGIDAAKLALILKMWGGTVRCRSVLIPNLFGDLCGQADISILAEEHTEGEGGGAHRKFIMNGDLRSCV